MLFQEQLEACAQDRYDEWNAANRSRLVLRRQYHNSCLPYVTTGSPLSGLCIHPLHVHTTLGATQELRLATPSDTDFLSPISHRTTDSWRCSRWPLSKRLTQGISWQVEEYFWLPKNCYFLVLIFRTYSALLHNFSKFQTSLNQRRRFIFSW